MLSDYTLNALKQIIKHFKGKKAGSEMILPYLFAQQLSFCYYKNVIVKMMNSSILKP